MPVAKEGFACCEDLSCAISQLIGTVEYDAYGSDILDSIPEHDWKLLAALARKREEDAERERLAEQFQKMWMKEKEERQLVEAETSEQYKRYLQEKREQERSWLEYRRLERELEEGAKRGQLISCIRHKEKRCADQLAFRDDRKTTELVSKAIEEEARFALAAERRWVLGAGEAWRREVQRRNAARRADAAGTRRAAFLRDAAQNRAPVEDAKEETCRYADNRIAGCWRREMQRRNAARRADAAGTRRAAFLRDAAQRAAITNALSSWESSLLRQEVEAQNEAKRAVTAATAALKDARRSRLRHARDCRKTRAAKLAALTSRLREAIRNSNA